MLLAKYSNELEKDLNNISNFNNAKHSLEKGLQHLVELLGAKNVSSNLEDRLFYSRSTLSYGTMPTAIVKPACREEVESIVKIANQYNLQIHPISTGKNWGYSDACAVKQGQILLNLSRMNRILAINENLGYITIEPGVTQGQVYEYLKKNKIKLWVDATGAGPDTSIIGNTMDRGFGHSPLGDRFGNSCGYEVVLPTGEVINTGFGHFENSKVTEIYKCGVGPSLDGLFTQSNLGIITKMTLWLMPAPESYEVVAFMLKDEKDISEFIDRIRPLRMNGTLKSVIHIGNDLRLISMSQSFPFEEVDGSRALSKEKRKELARKHGIGFWSGTAGLYGSKDQIRADLKAIKKSLKGFKGLKAFVVLNESRLFLLQKTIRLFNRFGFCKDLAVLSQKAQLAFDLLKGKSPENCVQGGLWRVKNMKNIVKNSTDPLDYQAGFYWISPVLPMEGTHIKRMNSIVEPIFNQYGFDLQQTISLTTERALTSVLTISFDKKNEIESQKARLCHDEVVKILIKEGYIMYRAGNHSMDLLFEQSNPYCKFLQKIKSAIDPSQIVSPGKYIPEL